MEIRIPYGNTFIAAQVPEHISADIIDLPQNPAASNPSAEVRKALSEMRGEFSWSDFKQAQSVAIAINDKTRPVPHQFLLPPLLEQLDAQGIPEEIISFYIAVGTHPPMVPEEFCAILPGASVEDSMKMAERIRYAVQESKVNYTEYEIKVTLSMGITSYPENNVENEQMLLSTADEALYISKESGRNKSSIK